MSLELLCAEGKLLLPTKRVYYKIEKTGYRSRSNPLQPHPFKMIAEQIFKEIAPSTMKLLTSKE